MSESSRCGISVRGETIGAATCATWAAARIRLQAAHFTGDRRIEDRTGAYIPFVEQLRSRIAAANPAAAFEVGRHWLAIADEVIGSLVVGAQKATRFVDLDRAAGAAAWLMRKIGPRLKGHRVAMSLSELLTTSIHLRRVATLEFHVQGHADGVGRGGELEFGLLGVKAAGAFDGEIVHPLERRGEMVGRGGEVYFQFMAAGNFIAVPGEFVVKGIAAQDAVRPIKGPGQLFV